MSSTNRSSARDSHVADYYVTPPIDIQEFLDAFLNNHPDIQLDKMSILDPCAWGNPPDTPMSYPTILEWYNPKRLITNDIRLDSPAMYHVDFINHDMQPDQYDMTITNPPFNLALDIIKKSLHVTREWGYVIMLLRLNFFGSKWRKSFFDAHMPIETYVHHKRISFAKGATDSIEYMHCVFQKGYNPPHTKLYII